MTFNYDGYDLKFVQKHPCRDGSEHLYTLIYKFFSPRTHYNYILRAEYHKEDVFCIKFYCSKDKHSPYKYSKIVNKGDLGNILVTCLKVIPILLKEYPNVSFAFTGSRSIDFKSNKRVEDYRNNQRFRVYKYIVAKKIGTDTFVHFEYKEQSSYLLINKRVQNVSQKEKAMVDMFVRTYRDLYTLQN